VGCELGGDRGGGEKGAVEVEGDDGFVSGGHFEGVNGSKIVVQGWWELLFSMVRGLVYSTVQRNCKHIVYAATVARVRNLRSTVIGDVCGVCIG
jgi:hypothetical protein